MSTKFYNNAKTALLLGLLTGGILAIGSIWGQQGVIVAVVFAVVTNIVGYFFSDKIALATMRAQQVGPESELYQIVAELARRGNLPMPRVYVSPQAAPNAFATGRNPKHAAIAVTSGLLDKMNRVELEGVLAHELSHIRNYDILVSTLAVTLVGAVALLANFGIRMMWWNGGRERRSGDRNDGGNPLAIIGLVLLVFAPIIAKVMQAAISRRRETLADVSACQLTRYPPGLISALEKLRDDTTVTHAASAATAHMWIEQPMSGVGDHGKLGSINKMFDTHPPLEERIALLREL